LGDPIVDWRQPGNALIELGRTRLQFSVLRGSRSHRPHCLCSRSSEDSHEMVFA